MKNRNNNTHTKGKKRQTFDRRIQTHLPTKYNTKNSRKNNQQ